jgi:hypothetical protein
LETAEFAQLVACCGAAFRTNGAAPAVNAGLDWNAFLALARRHRVQGLVWRSLHPLRDSMPGDIAAALADDARAIGHHGMQSAAECARLQQALGAARVDVMFVKGLALSKLAYGDPFVKMSRDIDILIDPVQLREAANQLEKLGYRLAIPVSGDPKGLHRWHGSRKESVWALSGRDIILELHTRLSDNRKLLRGVGAISPRQDVQIIPGIGLPTLAADEQFAYLCVHGASSAWFRLKWLADLAALLEGCNEEEITRLYRRSLELGAGRSAAQALLLARAVFATRLEPALASELEGKRTNRWLTRLPWREMTKAREPTEGRFGTATIHFSQFLLLPGIRFKLCELRRQIADAAGNRA